MASRGNPPEAWPALTLDAINREAYSHEMISAGFWPGGSGVVQAAFYGYAAPEPAGFSESPARPPGTFCHPELKESLLPYEEVRVSPSPRDALLDFLQSSTFEAGADLARWDRRQLERA